MASVEWHEFEPETLRLAREQQRPVVLVLTVPWCNHCSRLRSTTLEDASVQRALQSGFVSAHCDAERRPDVNERYGTGAWPTIAWVSGDGELLRHESFLTADELLPILEEMARTEPPIGSLPGDTLEPQPTPEPPHSLTAEIVEDTTRSIYEGFDHRYGGWGDKTKFPHTEALDFALIQVAKRDDTQMREVVTTTLDRMRSGAIHDAIDGGFFRFSETPDWRSPNFEKLLDTNVQRLRCYLEAYQVTETAEYREVANGIVDWMLEFLLDDETGAFFGSLDADADYYALPAEARAKAERPRADRTIYAHANAMAVSNLIKAAIVLDRDELQQRAMATLGFLLERLSDRDGEVYHYWDGTYHLPGRLADQACFIRALIDASQRTGDADLLLPAERVASNVIERQRAPGGGFYDILQDPAYSGSMSRRNRSILENSSMAEALMRLSLLSRRPEFYKEAVRTLEAFVDDYKQYGYYVAGYGRAVDLVFYQPLTVTIIGARDSDEANALRQTALGGYFPSRIVQTLDPERDPILLERSGLPIDQAPAAHVQIGAGPHRTATSPEELSATMRALETGRRQS